jgi:D-alanyl-lipoteichoic acid acyltransferase DltB (MBOAT superfamily)
MFLLAHAAIGAYIVFLASPRFLVFYGLYWGVVVLMQSAIAWARENSLRHRSWLFAACAIAALLPMVLWKLLPDLFVEKLTVAMGRIVWGISPFIGGIDLSTDIVAPIGLSFATFRAVDLLIKSHVGLVDRQRPDKLMAYGFFAPVLIAGPIAEYEEIENSKRSARPQPDDIVIGMARFGLGLVKIWGVAWLIEPSQAIFRADDSNNAAVFWFMLIVFTWYFYINFSGYSDCAIGLARLAGVRLKENFANPYLQTSPQAFWASWHMSLTRFAQRNVFVPLGGYRASSQYIAIVGTMMVIALWHNLSFNMVLFGLYHSAALIAQRHLDHDKSRRVLGAIEPRARKVLLTCSTYFFVVVSFPLLMLHTPVEAGVFYLNLLGVR